MKAPFRRSRRRSVSGLFLIAAASVALSCTDATSPTDVRPNTAEPGRSLLGNLLGRLNLLTCTPLPAYSATQTIGSAGGTMHIGPHTFSVPAGALSGPVTITATAPSVPRREVRFEPHGLTFAEPARLTMSYKGCSLVSRLLPKKIVYTSDDLDPLELLLSLDFPLLQKVTGRVEHFSGYVVWY